MMDNIFRDYRRARGYTQCQLADLLDVDQTTISKWESLCRKYQVTSKVIFENCYLTDEEKIGLCKIAKEVRPDFIKTSTGFGPLSATVEDVKLMKKYAGDDVKVKAAGGIRNLETCLAMIDAGAERIGCSNSTAIADEYKNAKRSR